MFQLYLDESQTRQGGNSAICLAGIAVQAEDHDRQLIPQLGTLKAKFGLISRIPLLLCYTKRTFGPKRITDLTGTFLWHHITVDFGRILSRKTYTANSIKFFRHHRLP